MLLASSHGLCDTLGVGESVRLYQKEHCCNAYNDVHHRDLLAKSSQELTR